MLKEFKEFALRGNVLDLAVGVIIGAAFGKVVSSVVDDVIMPPLGKLIGNVDFSSLFINLSGTHYDTLAEAKAHSAATLNYGIFINTIINFLIISFAIFWVVKAMSRVVRKEAPPELGPTQTEVLLAEIRDLLATQRRPSV